MFLVLLLWAFFEFWSGVFPFTSAPRSLPLPPLVLRTSQNRRASNVFSRSILRRTFAWRVCFFASDFDYSIEFAGANRSETRCSRLEVSSERVSHRVLIGISYTLGVVVPSREGRALHWRSTFSRTQCSRMHFEMLGRERSRVLSVQVRRARRSVSIEPSAQLSPRAANPPRVEF